MPENQIELIVRIPLPSGTKEELTLEQFRALYARCTAIMQQIAPSTLRILDSTGNPATPPASTPEVPPLG